MHFRQDRSGWMIDDRLRKMVHFQRLNLLTTSPELSAFNLILLRNVLIYMAPLGRQTILSRLQKSLDPEGYLMLGSTESVKLPNVKVACAPAGEL